MQTAGDTAEAQRLYREVLAIDPNYSLASFNLGVDALGRGALQEAAKLFIAAWDSNPGHIESVVNLIYTLQTQNRHDDIKALFPKFAAVATKLYGERDVNGAMRLSELMISLDTEFLMPDPHWIRANCLMSLKRAAEALEQFNGVTKLWPQYGLSCLGNIGPLYWVLMGDADMAAQCARRLLATATAGSTFELSALETLLKTLPYHAATGMSDLKETADRYFQIVSAKRTPVATPPVADPAGALRIAFLIDKSVSSGASRGLWELIRRLPDHKIEPTIHDVSAAASGGGLEGLPPEEAATRLRGMKYDIVVDATDPALTTPPGLFDYRAAPVQLAFPHRVYPVASRQIDGAFATADMMAVDDAGEAIRWLQLPGSFLCAEPPASAPAIDPCPSEKAGFVTFGLLAPAGAVGYSALDVYAAVLGSLPDSRLLIVNELVGQVEYQERVLARLARNRITADRVTFRAAIAHGDILAALNEIDVVLDSFPVPSFLTADVAWQGVMTVGLGAGSHPMARRAIATYQALGMSDLLAPDRDDMQSIAVNLARDVDRRRSFRAEARGKLAGSPAFDSAGFARDFATLLRTACVSK